MVVEDLGVKPKVCGNQGPGDEEGDETEECAAGLVASLMANVDYVQGSVEQSVGAEGRQLKLDIRLNSVQNKHRTAGIHPNLVEWKLVDIVGYERIVRNSKSVKR